MELQVVQSREAPNPLLTFERPASGRLELTCQSHDQRHLVFDVSGHSRACVKIDADIYRNQFGRSGIEIELQSAGSAEERLGSMRDHRNGDMERKERHRCEPFV